MPNIFNSLLTFNNPTDSHLPEKIFCIVPVTDFQCITASN